MKRKRIEKDFLGEKEIPPGAYFGIHTVRSLENFRLSSRRFQPVFIQALALTKMACCRANRELGRLAAGKADAIERACLEVLDGTLGDQFPLDVFQSGSGTSVNMNANEVIANRACEILGGKKGDRALVHPNDHVNMGQSTNNVIPTAMRLSAWKLLKGLLDSLGSLETALKQKAREFKAVIKSGRTHLQDAVPITLGQEFGAWAAAVKKSRRRIDCAAPFLKSLGIGGNAVGTGINTPREFRGTVIKHLNALTGGDFRTAADGLEATQFLTDIAHLSSALRLASMDLGKIANDLRLLSSGPRTGLAEISLPPVEPGSSIMPGKVNPSILEALNMVCFQIQGNDHALAQAAQAGQLELNTHMPMMAFNLIESMELLTAGAATMAKKCIMGIRANEDRCRENFEKSAGLATALNPVLGYDRVSALVRKALGEGKSLVEVVREEGAMSEGELKKILNPRTLTRPNIRLGKKSRKR